MPSQRTIPEILSIAKVGQYLAFNDVDNANFMRGGALDNRLPIMIACERMCIQWVYDVEPSNLTLRGTSNYLYDLLGPFALQAENIIEGIVNSTPPQITGPADVSLNISGTAVFTVTATEGATIKWYKNGVEVAGQTGLTYSYSVTVANNGDQVWATATNAAGSATSRTATLSVSNELTVYFHIGDEDKYPEILSGLDNIEYQSTKTVAPDAVTFDFELTPEMANNRWQVFKYPRSLGYAIEFYSTEQNKGLIPGPEYYDKVEIGDFYYTCSREALSFVSNPFNPLVIKLS